MENKNRNQNNNQNRNENKNNQNKNENKNNNNNKMTLLQLLYKVSFLLLYCLQLTKFTQPAHPSATYL